MARFARAALVVAILASSLTLLTGSAPAASAVVNDAVQWLRSQQEADGGFELADFPPLETPDAVMALSAAAQTGSAWSAAQARAAVLGTSTATGKTPLSAVDDYVSGSIGPGQAGKVITLVTNPLALDPAAFDPSNNGETNLVTKLGVPGGDNKFGISLGSFNDILYAVRGYARVASVPTATITVLRTAQNSDGSWSYDGLSDTSTPGDPDTTGLAVQALLEAGVAASDGDVDAALDFLELQQQGNGSWTNGFDENPNSTAVAMLALAAGGRSGPLAAGDAYLTANQQAAGFIAGPYDFGNPNTSGTSQAIQALVRKAVPTASAFATPETVVPATGGGAVTLESSTGTLSNITTISPTTLPAAPSGASFPRGLFGFEIELPPATTSATVSLILPVGTTVNRYFKYRGTGWFDATSMATIAGNVVTLTLTDGGPGDDDGVVNGTIVDPGGPAFVRPATTTVAGFAG